MKIYLMTSPKFDGEIRFEYDEATGLLRTLDVQAELTVAYHEQLFGRLPVTAVGMENFRRFLKEIKSPATVTQFTQTVDFEGFWKRYFAGRGSDNSSKKKAETRWNRMTKSEQAKAYNFVAQYMRRIPAGVGVKLAETYLNSEIWNN